MLKRESARETPKGIRGHLPRYLGYTISLIIRNPVITPKMEIIISPRGRSNFKSISQDVERRRAPAGIGNPMKSLTFKTLNLANLRAPESR